MTTNDSLMRQTDGTAIHVDPAGDDRALGTAEQPFASLERACLALRERRAAGSGPLLVLLAGGTYRQSQTVVLGADDGGTEAVPVIYAALPGARPIISAGAAVEGWTPLTALPEGAPLIAAGQLWEAPWPHAASNALFDDGGLLVRAAVGPYRSARPDRQSQVRYGWEIVGDPSTNTVLHVDPALFKPWHDPLAMEVAAQPLPWVWNLLPVAAMDRTSGVIRTTVPGSFTLDAEGCVFHLENVPEGLAAPGTWWLDRQGQRLVLWPRNPGVPSGIVAPLRSGALCLRGESNRPVEHVQFHGLTFAHGDRPTRTMDDGMMILQHEWEYFDVESAVVRLRDTANILFEDCTFTASGGGGLRMDYGARANAVRHCAFYELGGIGISLCGLRPGAGDVHHGHDLGWNLIHHVGRILRCAPGIFLYQSGHSLIHDNRLSDLPYVGMILFGDRSLFGVAGVVPAEVLYGGGNRIEHNEVTRIMQQLGDGSGIYLSATPAGNVVRRNHIHDITSQINGGVRTDDLQSDVLVAENLIHDLNGFGIILKHVNHCRHNVVVDCRTLISVRHFGPNRGSTIIGNILARLTPVDPQAGRYDVDPAKNAYAPFFSEYVPVKIEDYELAGNVLFSPTQPELAVRAMAALVAIGKQPGIIADPGFVAAAARDFHVVADSPAYAVGFPHIDVWGPRGPGGPRR